MRVFNEEKLQELQFKKKWCLVILSFFKSQSHGVAKQIYEMAESDVERAYKIKFLSGLRAAYNDINEMAKAMRSDDIIKLNIILREKFGKDLTTVNKRIAARIQKIEERGYIKTEGEWRMVRDWIDHIMWDDAKDKEVELLDYLLEEYDKSIQKKRAAKKEKNAIQQKNQKYGKN